MKKIFICLVSALCLFGIAGCEKVETYKEGIYEGSAIDTYNNENNTATAKITVDSNGRITDVYLDTTYNGSTKKELGDDYNMKKYNSSAAGEWYEQVEKLEKAVIDNQGIDFLNLDDEGYTDAVSGCTIKVDALYAALSDALKKAK